MKDFNFLQQKYVLNTFINRQLTLVKGDGMYLYDDHGKKFLDMMGNYGVSIFGYSHPVITKVLVNQLKTLPSLHGSFSNDMRSFASEQLIKRSSPGYTHVYWSNSGAEAVEAALKFAILTTGKKRIIACERSYHGKTLAALSATHGKKYREPFESLLLPATHIPYNNIAALSKAITSDAAAFIVEPIQGESGIITPDKTYLKKARDICTRHDILLILDEIQTGTGRTGTFLASQKSGTSADILCLGKGLAAGLPVGATLMSGKVAQSIPKHIQTSTFGGNPLVMAAVKTVLELLTDKQLKQISQMGEYFRKQIADLKNSQIIEVRGDGLMIGVVVKEKRDVVLKKLQENGVLTIPAGDNVVRFLPPYILEKQNIDLAADKLDTILRLEIRN